MDKGIQNSVFFQNAAGNLPNFEYDMQQLYRQFARPVLCPVMAIPQDMLYNLQGLGNLPTTADLSSHDKILQGSVQKVFISSTSCFQSYKPKRRSRVSSKELKKDAAVLTSKQRFDEKKQKRDIGIPKTAVENPKSSSRNLHCIYKKNENESIIIDNDSKNNKFTLLKDAQCGNESEKNINNDIERDVRLKMLIKKLLAARNREKQCGKYKRVDKTQCNNAQTGNKEMLDENNDFIEIKPIFRSGLREDVYNTYYANCENYFGSPKKRKSFRSKPLRRNLSKRPSVKNRHCCYPMSSQGRFMVIQRERNEKSKLTQPQHPQESTTCDSSCECHDFDYYNKKIRSILNKYGESFECQNVCWPIKEPSIIQNPVPKKIQHDTFDIEEKKEIAKKFYEQFDITYPPCSCFPGDTNDTDTLSTTTAVTDEMAKDNQKDIRSKQECIGFRQRRRSTHEDYKIEHETFDPNNGAMQQKVYEQNTCDGMKSDSFPYMCSCFKKKKVQDKAILTRTCCKNNLKSFGAQTEGSLRSQDDSVQTHDSINFSCCMHEMKKVDNNKQSWVPRDSQNFTINGTTPSKISQSIKRQVDDKMKNVYPYTSNDTVREIHKEKLQGLFDKYSDVKTVISNFTLPNLYGKNYTNPSECNFQKKCDSIREQIQQQKHEVKQLSSQDGGSNDFLLNIIGRLDELTQIINTYVNKPKYANSSEYQAKSQNSKMNSNVWNFNMQQVNRPAKLDADTTSSIIPMQHISTQFGTSRAQLDKKFQKDTSKIKTVKKEVEGIINDIIKKVNAVGTDSLKKPTVGDVTEHRSKDYISNHHKISIAVNTDPLGLVSLLKMSTEALMRFLSYFPMVSSNPIFGIAYKQCVSHYVCNICGAIFQRSSQLSDHIEKQHNHEEIRDCCICRHTLELQQQPVEGIFTCQHCGRHFSRAYCCELHEQECAKHHGIKPELASSLALLR